MFVASYVLNSLDTGAGGDGVRVTTQDENIVVVTTLRLSNDIVVHPVLNDSVELEIDIDLPFPSAAMMASPSSLLIPTTGA